MQRWFASPAAICGTVLGGIIAGGEAPPKKEPSPSEVEFDERLQRFRLKSDRTNIIPTPSWGCLRSPTHAHHWVVNGEAGTQKCRYCGKEEEVPAPPAVERGPMTLKPEE